MSYGTSEYGTTYYSSNEGISIAYQLRQIKHPVTNEILATDTLHINHSTESMYITKRTDRKIFNGTETWLKHDDSNESKSLFYIDFPLSTKSLQTSMSTLFANVSAPISNDTIWTYGDSESNTYKFFNYLPDIDLATWKTYLANQYANDTPLIVDYVLENPVTINLVYQESKSIYPNTSVFTNSDIDPMITVTTRKLI